MSKASLTFALAFALASVASQAGTVNKAETAKKAETANKAETAKEPDISGVWEIYPDPFAGAELSFLELPVPGDGPKLKEPYASEWKRSRAEREQLLKAGTPRVDSNSQCLPEGMPLVMGAIFPLEFLQTPGRITVLGEFLTQTRRIYLDRPMPPVESLNPNFYGFSVGHWEGDTLVVTTKGVHDKPVFFDIPFSRDMVIKERIRLTGPDLMEDVITIEDPRLVEPYTFTYGYKRNPNYVIEEYFCEREDPLFKVGQDGTMEMKTGDEIK